MSNLFYQKLEAIEQLFSDDMPDYLQIGNGYVKVRTEDEWHKITAKDVAKYYAFQARNLGSGWRSIGSIGGDWRLVDELASMLLAIFKILSVNRLRKEAIKFGITPKF